MRNAFRIALGAIWLALVAAPSVGLAQTSTNVQSQQNVTPTDCSVALTTGGVAQNIITAGNTLHGFCIMNIDTTAGSGEPAWMSFSGAAAASAVGSYPLAAPTATTFALPGSYCSPVGAGFNSNVSVVAATSEHKISCTKW